MESHQSGFYLCYSSKGLVLRFILNLFFLSPNALCYFWQIGDLKGFFGLVMVNIQMLREKLKVLDVSYGRGTGN